MNKLVIILSFLLLNCNSHNLKQDNVHLEKDTYKNQIFPKQTGVINDYETILLEEQKEELNTIIQTFKQETKIQIIVLTLNSIKPYNDIQKYSTDLGNNWNLTGNNLIIAFSKQQRTVGIATDLNVQKVLTDSICQSIINTDMVPEFKKNNYYNGLKKGIISIINKLKPLS